MKTLRPPSQPRPAFAPGSPDRPPKAVGNRNAGWPRPYLRVSFQTGFRAGCQQVADRQEGLSCSGADRLQDEVGAETNDFFVPQRVSVLYFESERERPEAALFQVPNGNILRGAGERWRLSEPFLASELARSPVQEGVLPYRIFRIAWRIRSLGNRRAQPAQSLSRGKGSDGSG